MEDLIKKWEAQLEVLNTLRADLITNGYDGTCDVIIIIDGKTQGLGSIIKSMKK